MVFARGKISIWFGSVSAVLECDSTGESKISNMQKKSKLNLLSMF